MYPNVVIVIICRQLAPMPQKLVEMGIRVAKAETVRINNAPTRTRAGYVWFVAPTQFERR